MHGSSHQHLCSKLLLPPLVCGITALVNSSRSRGGIPSIAMLKAMAPSSCIESDALLPKTVNPYPRTLLAAELRVHRSKS